MDESQSARQRHMKPSDISEDTCNILSAERDTLPNDAEERAGRRRKSSARLQDPEATNRIGESTEGRREKTARQVTAGRFRQDVRILDISRHSPPNEVPSLVPVADPEPLTVGTELDGRYVIVEEASESSMSLVYKALDRQRELAGDSSPYVALKVARTADQAGDDFTQHLREEFVKLSRLHHPNIVAAYDLRSWRGNEFLVLEWLEGETLASRLDALSARRLALQTARQIIGDVAAALAHAHVAGVVHGDVKPSNIFLTDDHRTILFDFGATTSASPDSGTDNRQQWATRAYASPDVLSGDVPQPSDDVFALGVTAYRLLTGEHPFGDPAAARREGLAPDPVPEDARSHWPAIRHALSFDAVERPRTAADFLERFFEERYEEPSPPPVSWPKLSDLGRLEWTALATIASTLVAGWLLAGPGDLPRSSVVETLLAEADLALRSGRMAGPAAGSAADHYRAVLEHDPGNLAAKAGLDDIAETFLTRARGALARQDYEAVATNLAAAKRLSPRHFGIVAIEDVVGRYQRDLLIGAREAATSDMNRAERLLAQAEALSSAGDPAVARTAAELKAERLASDVDALVQSVDERILSERLLLPEGDSAMDRLAEVTSIAPGNRQVRMATDRLTSALLFQAMFAIPNGNLDEAARFIDAAKSLNVEHLALARAEYELAKARSAEVRRRTGADIP